jgi:glycosyltransferase involved in cell wall biosynthesis
MHILIANRWFPPEGGWGGGVRIWNYNIARAFRALGHQVTVLASSSNVASPAQSEIEGIRVFRLPVRDSYRLRQLPGLKHYVRAIQQLSYSWRVRQAIHRLHNADPVDVVEFAEVGAEGFFCSRAPETAVVVRCHTPTFVLSRYYTRAEMPGDNRIIGWCEKESIRRAHALTTPSRDLARIIAAECAIAGNLVEPIPNALEIDGFASPAPEVARDPVVVLYVGRLERIKGVGTLAQAIPEVIRHTPKIRFVFIGDDRPTPQGNSQREELEKQLDEAGVCANVEFLGKVDQSALREWYRRSHICVVPSMLYESFSYTVAQGMAAGKPVVASRIGGIPETLDDGECGLLVAPGNTEELAQAIVCLASDPLMRARLGRAGQAKVKREFDPGIVAERTLKVYERARRKFSA